MCTDLSFICLNMCVKVWPHTVAQKVRPNDFREQPAL